MIDVSRAWNLYEEKNNLTPDIVSYGPRDRRSQSPRCPEQNGFIGSKVDSPIVVLFGTLRFFSNDICQVPAVIRMGNFYCGSRGEIYL